MYLAKRFFHRIDVFRSYSRALLLVCLFSMFASRSFSIAFFILGAGCVIFGIGSFFKVPSPSVIAEFVSNEHHAFEQEIRRHRSNVNEREFHTLHTYSPKRQRLARNIGNQMYFPEFHTMVFQKTEKGLILYLKTTYLYENVKPKTEEHLFCGEGVLVLECGEADSEEEYRLVLFKHEGETVLECYIRNDHLWRTFLTFASDVVCAEKIKEE